MKPELTKTLMALAYNAQCAFAYGHDNYEEQKTTLREAIEATELQLDSLQEEVWKLNAMLAAQPAPQQNRPVNCGTSYCSCIECPFEAQPVAQSTTYRQRLDASSEAVEIAALERINALESRNQMLLEALKKIRKGLAEGGSAHSIYCRVNPIVTAAMAAVEGKHE